MGSDEVVLDEDAGLEFALVQHDVVRITMRTTSPVRLRRMAAGSTVTISADFPLQELVAGVRGLERRNR